MTCVPATDVPSLFPAQVCFVVDDVARAAAECESRFGWGPFHIFSAPVSDASYHDWRGPKLTHVALGMAGGVQVELIHVETGRDTVAEYGNPSYVHVADTSDLRFYDIDIDTVVVLTRGALSAASAKQEHSPIPDDFLKPLSLAPRRHLEELRSAKDPI